MSTNRRAAMRREQKERDKLKLSEQERLWIARGFNDPVGKRALEKSHKRYYDAGRSEGMQTATGIIFLALHEYFGFGSRRFEKLMDCIAKESIKMDEMPTAFNVDYYIRELNKVMKMHFEKCENDLDEVGGNVVGK